MEGVFGCNNIHVEKGKYSPWGSFWDKISIHFSATEAPWNLPPYLMKLEWNLRKKVVRIIFSPVWRRKKCTKNPIHLGVTSAACAPAWLVVADAISVISPPLNLFTLVLSNESLHTIVGSCKYSTSTHDYLHTWILVYKSMCTIWTHVFMIGHMCMKMCTLE